MSRTDIIVRHGLTTDVLGRRFTERLAPLLPQAVQDTWWERTDYAWACSVCPNTASVKWLSLEDAHEDAVVHAHEHGGAKVEHAPAQGAGERR